MLNRMLAAAAATVQGMTGATCADELPSDIYNLLVAQDPSTRPNWLVSRKIEASGHELHHPPCPAICLHA